MLIIDALLKAKMRLHLLDESYESLPALAFFLFPAGLSDRVRSRRLPG